MLWWLRLLVGSAALVEWAVLAARVPPRLLALPTPSPLPSIPVSIHSPDSDLQDFAGRYKCEGWHQTRRCDPDGPREPGLDRGCDEVIRQGWSGFCVVSSLVTGERARIQAVGCAHPEFSCDFFVHRAGLAREVARASAGDGGSKSGVGVVMMAADKFVVDTFVVVKMLRATGCTLPVQLFHTGSELNLNSHHAKLLRKEPGVTLHAIPRGPSSRLHGFWLKPLVLLLTSLRHVLFLDSDNVPVVNPERLFGERPFLDTGALFWKDFWHPNSTFDGWRHLITAGSHIWGATGLEFVHDFEQESGQLVVDTLRHYAPLQAAVFMAANRDFFAREDTIWGDKDLYRLAFMKCNHSFHLVSHPPASAGVLVDSDAGWGHFGGERALEGKGEDGRLGASAVAAPSTAPGPARRRRTFCGNTMVQHDTAGRVVFMHRNFAKLSSPGGRQEVWHAVATHRGPPFRLDVQAHGAVWRVVMLSDGQETRRWVRSPGPVSWKPCLPCFTIQDARVQVVRQCRGNETECSRRPARGAANHQEEDGEDGDEDEEEGGLGWLAEAEKRLLSFLRSADPSTALAHSAPRPLTA